METKQYKVMKLSIQNESLWNGNNKEKHIHKNLLEINGSMFGKCVKKGSRSKRRIKKLVRKCKSQINTRKTAYNSSRVWNTGFGQDDRGGHKAPSA